MDNRWACIISRREESNLAWSQMRIATRFGNPFIVKTICSFAQFFSIFLWSLVTLHLVIVFIGISSANGDKLTALPEMDALG